MGDDEKTWPNCCPSGSDANWVRFDGAAVCLDGYFTKAQLLHLATHLPDED